MLVLAAVVAVANVRGAGLGADRAGPAPAGPRRRQRRAHHRVPRASASPARSSRSCSRWRFSARRPPRRSASSPTLIDAVMFRRPWHRNADEPRRMGLVPDHRRADRRGAGPARPAPGTENALGFAGARPPRLHDHELPELRRWSPGSLEASGEVSFRESLQVRLSHGPARQSSPPASSRPASRSATSASASEPSGSPPSCCSSSSTCSRPASRRTSAARSSQQRTQGARLAAGRAHQHRACRPCRCGTP